MVESRDSRMERTFLSRWGLPIVVGTLVAGGSYWLFSSRTPDAQAIPPVVAVHGTAFDVPPTKESQPPAPPAEPAKGENPAAANLAPVPKSVLTPVPVASLVPPAAENAAEAKTTEQPVQGKVDPQIVGKAPETKAESKPVEPDVKEKAPAPKAVEAKADAADGKAVLVPFSKLAFKYWPPVKGGRDPFPAEIKKLDGKKIVIEGFMMPIDFDKGKIQTFLLTRNMMGCCYADSFQITDVIKVQRTDGKSCTYMQMARVIGTLEVGEEKDSEGYIESVYRIKADDLAPALFGK